MEFTTYVRKPFEIEAVQITPQNIEELAPLIGQLRRFGDGKPYIFVDRQLVPNLDRVFPGFWVTRIGDNIRCYSKRVFADQFTSITPEIKEWMDYMNTKDDRQEERSSSTTT